MNESIRRIVVDLTRKEISDVSEQNEVINEDINDHYFQVDYLAAWPGIGIRKPEAGQHRRYTIGSEKPCFDETSI